jgi:hypothetical protein
MSTAIEDEVIFGFYVFEPSKFYYLESGGPRSSTSFDRLRSVLLSRRIISMVDKPNYEIITVAEAKKRSLEFQPIFTSPHVRQIWEEKQKSNTGAKKWS